MTSLAKGQILIRVLTPQQMGQAVAEWVLTRQGVTEGSSVRVKTEFVFTRGNESKLSHGAKTDGSQNDGGVQ